MKRKRRHELKNATYTSDQLLKAATNFFYLVAQQVGEADSSVVTLSTRPTVNKVLTNMQFNNLVQKVVQDVVNKNPDIHGNLAISSFITNATLSNGNWVIDPTTSGLKVEGNLYNQVSVKNLIAKTNQAIFKTLAEELNRLTKGGSLIGNKITNHDTNINEVSLSV
jgi:hypothetical protein